MAAVSVSPFLPSVFADNGAWQTAPIADASWDYDMYRVQRLAFDQTVNGPFDYSGAVFVTQKAQTCAFTECDRVDVSIFKDGSALTIGNVSDNISSEFWHQSQDNRFVFETPSSDKKTWFTVSEYLPETGDVQTRTSIKRKDNGLALTTFATHGSRVYSSSIHEDENSSDVEATLAVTDYVSGYQRDDFTYALTAPWQEIVDVHNETLLVKFAFDGGFEQLWLIDEQARHMEAVPNTWTEPNADIIAPHFRSDGSVQYFRNFQLFTYMPGEDTFPQEHGGAFLNWFTQPADAIQIVGDRLAYVDSKNALYVSDLDRVSPFGKIIDGQFTLEEDAIYLQTVEGYKEYVFATGTWNNYNFRVTSVYEDIKVGVDANQNIWYQNMTTGRVLNIGFGSTPLLTDRNHAIWKGTDGNVYQVTFSELLDLAPQKVEAFKAFDNPTVYIVSDNKIWNVSDEQTYFTWFDSWEDVQSVSRANIDAFKNAYGFVASANFAPGTRIKTTVGPKVYIVGNDGALHWIVSEQVANDLYGPVWNKNIISVSPEKIYRYEMGKNVHDNTDIKTI